ncbi:MAG: hypothetical protein ACOYOB_20825, partial [Myxococcota bacterium]
ETSNERRRISEYGRSGSHLNRHVDSVLSAGKCIWYRAIAVNSKADARVLQDRLLAKFGYPWNRHGQ